MDILTTNLLKRRLGDAAKQHRLRKYLRGAAPDGIPLCLMEDSFLSAADQDSKIELAVLREQLQQYHTTMEKIQLLRETGPV